MNSSDASIFIAEFSLTTVWVSLRSSDCPRVLSCIPGPGPQQRGPVRPVSLQPGHCARGVCFCPDRNARLALYFSINSSKPFLGMPQSCAIRFPAIDLHDLVPFSHCHGQVLEIPSINRPAGLHIIDAYAACPLLRM